MNTFLEEVADELLREYNNSLDSLTIVFPNRRAGLFFNDVLSKKIKANSWAPQVITFEDLVCQLSDLIIADQLTLVYRLYEVFKNYSGTEEQFDRFYFWGEMLLKDFSEVDMALVDAEDIFTNLSDLKTLEAGYDYLSDDQKNAISKFWKSFELTGLGEKSENAQQKFLNLWTKLLPVYQAFTKALLQDGISYEGLVYRTLAENVHKIEGKTNGKVVLIGFNALKKAEEKIVVRLAKHHGARVFWDVDQHYIEHPVQETGLFFRQYLNHPVLQESFPKPLPDHFHNNTERHLAIKGVTLEVGQAKQVGVVLQELVKQKNFNPEKVAIIIPDEHLLFPVLHSLPPEIERVNVTMGYPLRNTSLYSFIEHLLNLQLEKKTEKDTTLYHHISLLSLLRHPYLRGYDAAKAKANIQHIEDKNTVYVRVEALQCDENFYQVLLKPVTNVPGLFDYLRDISGLIHRMVDSGRENTEEGTSIPMLEHELLYHFFLQVNRLKSLTSEGHFDFQLASFIRLLRQMFRSLRIPFTGEPLRGLQVMGLLESRSLDFDYVFVLSSNEGVLPPSDNQTSFIPQNLRKGFGLFTTEQQDAFYAYAFFRLLHRARQVYLYYNTEDTQDLSGEMSRFLYQLLYESKPEDDGKRTYPDEGGDLSVSQSFAKVQVAASPPQPIIIEKSEEVYKLLQYYCLSNDPGGKLHRLTPSALNTYLDCRLKFYFQYVVRLRESDSVDEEVDAAVFGNILHKVMETLYTDFVSREGKAEVTAQDCRQLKEKWLDKAIIGGFQEHYQLQQETDGLFEGRNAIAREVVRKMALQILKYDQEYAPFHIVSLEARGSQGYQMNLPIAANGQSVEVALKGIIDRIDDKDGYIRVLDYKTGRDERKAKDISSLFERDDPNRNKAVMQAMFYTWLYRKNQLDTNVVVAPGLINATELFNDTQDVRLQLEGGSVDDFAPYQDDFEHNLTLLLQEIFDPQTPFDQTTDTKKCQFCPYARICY